MTPQVSDHLQQVLRHLYINPLEKCNLKCKICYTRKTAPILKHQEILDFIKKYQAVQPIETITFCGGEVFALEYFPRLINQLGDQGIFCQMITNGTIDRLDEFTHPNLINLITSLDGLETYHDKNRAEGNFQKTLSFMKKGLQLGFHTDVFSIVTRQNLPQIDQFEAYLKQALGQEIIVTYHPRKPPTYLTVHPVSNIVGETDGFDFLTTDEMKAVMTTRNVFPPKDLGCYQIALASDGKVYGCCEGVTPIGTMNDQVETLIEQMRQRLLIWEKMEHNAGCLGCTQPDFMCGLKKYLT